MRYIANCSFGKDSLAQIIKIKELGLPLDEVIYCDIRFSNDISGEHPLLAEFIPKAEKILWEQFGIKVTHIKAERTFEDMFFYRFKKGKEEGNIYGFPSKWMRWCTGRLKQEPLELYQKEMKAKYGDYCSYIGYAHDEQNRIEKFKQNSYYTPERYKFILDELKITEAMAFDICREYDLVSPHYTLENTRGGCWFCFFQKKYNLYELWRDYPQYFKILEDLENNEENQKRRYSNMHASREPLKEMRRRFEEGYIPRVLKPKAKENIEQIDIFEYMAAVEE